MGRIRAAFFDIDGTMVSFKTHRMPDDVYDTLLKLKRDGVKIVVASGRPVSIIDNVRDVPFDAWVGCNGAQILDSDGNILFSNPIDREEAVTVARISTELQIPAFTFSNSESGINCINERSEEIRKLLNISIPPFRDLIHMCERQPIYEFTVYVTQEEESQIFRSRLSKVEYIRWHPSFTDINPAGSDKGVALRKLCNLWNIAPEDTVAFGDGGNDIPMIIAAGTGVAMGGAARSVIDAADMCTASVDDGGIAKALAVIG